jgi:hypothetical protein
MRRWQPTGVIVGAAALFLAAGPAQAQVWIGPPAGPTPPVRPVPPIGVVPGPVEVRPGWGARPYWGARRAFRRFARRW